jgi:hypothetical protein
MSAAAEQRTDVNIREREGFMVDSSRLARRTLELLFPAATQRLSRMLLR